MKSMDLELHLTSMMVHMSVFSLFILSFALYVAVEIVCATKEKPYINASTGKIGWKNWITNDTKGLE